jgi:hypothetical protein
MAAERPVHLKRAHAQRLREVYRSAGWPYQDTLEIELLAAGLLERLGDGHGQELVRVTQAGLVYLADALAGNRQAFSAHEALVAQVAQAMLRDGRLVWTALELRARLPDSPDAPSYWKTCKPDVFSIRNSSRPDYLEPIVHEIKVSRADLLGDLKRPHKRQAYLDVGGQVWYVLGCDGRGKQIASVDEIPVECGVMLCKDQRLSVLRAAPKRSVRHLPFGVWMALAKATPVKAHAVIVNGLRDQAPLVASEQSGDIGGEM